MFILHRQRDYLHNQVIIRVSSSSGNCPSIESVRRGILLKSLKEGGARKRDKWVCDARRNSL